MDAATRARLYHAQYHDYCADIPFWSALAHETGGPILEMGCGTGRLVSILAGMGYQILGVDQDPEMLALARKHLDPTLAGSVTWMNADLASFAWEGHIQLAIGALNTFAYLDDAAFCSALSAIASRLGVQSLIGLDLPPTDEETLSSIDDGSVLDYFDDPAFGSSIEVRANIQSSQEGHVEVSWIYDELYPDGTVERHIWEQMYFQRSEEDLRALIQDCNLKIRSIHGDYEFSPHHAGSKRLLLVLEKARK